MKQFDSSIDDTTNDVSDLMEKIMIEFREYKLNSSEDVEKSVSYIAFHLGREYFLTARDALSQHYVVGGGGIVRACFENLADLFYIFKTKERTLKYAEKYVLSMEVFKDTMLSLHDMEPKDVFAERKTKQVNKWAGGASIDDRVSDLSVSLLTAYDMFSYFSHPNPASLTFMGIPGLRDGQVNLSKQCNCLVAVMLMVVCIDHSDLKSVTVVELNEIAEKLGTSIYPETPSI